VAEPVFLTLDEVLAIHADQIRRYGGSHGVRDLGLLSSALAMPQASFGGAYLHTSLAEMAAAYLFHVAQNHPFLDGNKRAALAAALAFIRINDHRLEAGDDELTDLVMGVAAGRLGKADAAVFIASRLQPARKGGRDSARRGRRKLNPRS
jgi:death-on-curing protein